MLQTQDPKVRGGEGGGGWGVFFFSQTVLLNPFRTRRSMVFGWTDETAWTAMQYLKNSSKYRHEHFQRWTTVWVKGNHFKEFITPSFLWTMRTQNAKCSFIKSCDLFWTSRCSDRCRHNIIIASKNCTHHQHHVMSIQTSPPGKIRLLFLLTAALSNRCGRQQEFLTQ